MNLALRIFVIMALGAWTIWPSDFGLTVITFNLFKTHPIWAMLIAVAWVIVVTTMLPLKLRHYKLYTQVALALMTLVLFGQAYLIGLIDTTNWSMPLVSLGLAAIFIGIGWPIIANRLWQWMHYQRAVDPQTPDAGEHSH